jgi:hypothetical protein
MNKVLAGTVIKSICVPAKAPVSMRINWESCLNEIDESELQSEKHDEQRI